MASALSSRLCAKSSRFYERASSRERAGWALDLEQHQTPSRGSSREEMTCPWASFGTRYYRLASNGSSLDRAEIIDERSSTPYSRNSLLSLLSLSLSPTHPLSLSLSLSLSPARPLSRSLSCFQRSLTLLYQFQTRTLIFLTGNLAPRGAFWR